MRTVIEKNVSLQRAWDVLENGGKAILSGSDLIMSEGTLCWKCGHVPIQINSYKMRNNYTVQYDVEPSCENCINFGFNKCPYGSVRICEHWRIDTPTSYENVTVKDREESDGDQ